MVISTKPLAIANGEVWQIFQGHVLSVRHRIRVPAVAFRAG